MHEIGLLFVILVCKKLCPALRITLTFTTWDCLFQMILDDLVQSWPVWGRSLLLRLSNRIDELIFQAIRSCVLHEADDHVCVVWLTGAHKRCFAFRLYVLHEADDHLCVVYDYPIYIYIYASIMYISSCINTYMYYHIWSCVHIDDSSLAMLCSLVHDQDPDVRAASLHALARTAVRWSHGWGDVDEHSTEKSKFFLSHLLDY